MTKTTTNAKNFAVALHLFFLPFLFLCATACSTVGRQPPGLTLMPESQAEDTIEKNTVNRRVYDGFQNTIQLDLTEHNSVVLSALLDQNARMYQWSSEQYSLERNKVEGEKSTKAEFFLSIFLPDRKNDDLNKKTTKWKIFLDINGRRVEGTASKLRSQFQEIQALYPHFNRWSTAYRLTFPVSTSDVDHQPCTVTLTGPVGSVQAEFTKAEVAK
ncbi:MAG: hypothetical protein C5B49_10790 [Bdellovibrio sp.]|nr:MAG: hypothetical protein C5B49_10790 [Bdellovibrio sp.]